MGPQAAFTMINIQSKFRPLHWFEILLSLNLGAMIVMAKSQFIFPLLERTKFLFTPRWNISYFDAGVPAFWLLATVFGACIWVVLRLSSRARINKWFLLRLGGIIAMVGLSIVRFYYLTFVGWYRSLYVAFDQASPFYLVEIVAIVGFVSLYPQLMVTWRAAERLGLAVLLGHFLLWSWLWWTKSMGYPWSMLYPLLAFCGSLAWGMYIRSLPPSRQPATD